MNSKENIEASIEIRKSYERLPFQRFWSWFTGKELQNTKLIRSIHPILPTLWALIFYIGGLAASFIILIHEYNQFFLILSITFTTSGARNIVATIIHHGAHNAIFKKDSINQIICEILSTITVSQPFNSYKKFHVIEHHGRKFSTMEDQDLAAIYSLGIKPGVSTKKMKKILFVQLTNPLFHTKYFISRIKSNVINVPRYRLFMSILWAISLCKIAQTFGGTFFSISVLLPLIVLYQMCSLVQLITEHDWVLRQDGQTVRSSHIKNSRARFCGSALPKINLQGWSWLSAWAIWILTHLFVHLPSRILIVQGSLIVHDWHHRHGADRDWPNAIQKRELDLQAEISRGIYTYRDTWGINNAISESLESISNAPLAPKIAKYKYRLN